MLVVHSADEKKRIQNSTSGHSRYRFTDQKFMKQYFELADIKPQAKDAAEMNMLSTASFYAEKVRSQTSYNFSLESSHFVLV
jgi:hydroxymethylglutaryl-CoA reductase